MRQIFVLLLLCFSFLRGANALTWTSGTTAPNGGFFAGVGYGNGLFVGAGPDPILSSTDNGATWVNPTSTGSWNTGVAYGGGRWVVAAPNILSTSTDAITWNIGSTGSWPNWYPCITYGAGLFVAVGDFYGLGASYIRTSSDGLTWTDRTSPVTGHLTSVTYGNGLYVAVAASGSISNQVITSPDGITWTARSAAVQSNWKSVTYGGGVYVAVSTAGLVMSSSDGINWVQRTPALSTSWSAVTHGSGVFVAVSDAGTSVNSIMTSSDGANWTADTAPTSGIWYGVAFGNGFFVATGNTNVTMYAQVSAPAAVPSLSEWAQLMLGLMVITLIGWHFHRERSY